MIISTYNADGGCGKTPIATNIALELEYAVGTNEVFNLYHTFIEDEALICKGMEDEFPTYPSDTDVIFDLAGSISPSAYSISSALLQSRLVIVPTFYEDPMLVKTVGSIRAIQALPGFNADILVIATKLEKGRKEVFDASKPDEWASCEQYRYVIEFLSHNGLSVPVLPLKKSKVFDTISRQKRSIAQLCEDSKLAAHSYADVNAQFQRIFHYIETLENGQNSTSNRTAA